MGLLDNIKIENETFLTNKELNDIKTKVDKEYLNILNIMKGKISFFSYMSFLPYLKSIIESIHLYGKRNVSGKNIDPLNLNKNSKKELIKMVLDYVEDILTINEKVYTQCFFDPFYPIRENYSEALNFLKNFTNIPTVNITPWDDECVKKIDRKLFMNWKEYITIISSPSHYINKYKIEIKESYMSKKILDNFSTKIDGEKCGNYDYVKNIFSDLTKDLSLTFSNFLKIKENSQTNENSVPEEEQKITAVIEKFEISEESSHYNSFFDSIKYFFNNWENENLQTIISVIKQSTSSLSGKLLPVDRVYFVYLSFFFSILYQILYTNYYITLNQLIYIFYLSGLSSCFFENYNRSEYVKYYEEKLTVKEVKLIKGFFKKNIKNVKNKL